MGEPDFATPEVITKAAVAAMARGETHYTHSMGIMELRCAISENYRKRYGVEVDPARVLVTAGTSAAMLLLFSALLEEGQAVILSDPHYACYDNFISCAHIDADDYQLAFDILEKTGVAVTPGRDFGPGGRGFLRFSYCNSRKNIEQALSRLKDYLAGR
ncbi:MAG: aminotransferase class I/II-fold pyridoxal phosphate-dependent enzyme [Desulfosalsimonas sp.]